MTELVEALGLDNSSIRRVSGLFSIGLVSTQKQTVRFSCEYRDEEGHGSVQASLQLAGTAKELWAVSVDVDPNDTSKVTGSSWNRKTWAQLKTLTGFEGIDTRALEQFVKSVSMELLTQLEQTLGKEDAYGTPIGLDSSHLDVVLKLTPQKQRRSQGRSSAAAAVAAAPIAAGEDSMSNGSGGEWYDCEDQQQQQQQQGLLPQNQLRPCYSRCASSNSSG